MTLGSCSICSLNWLVYSFLCLILIWNRMNCGKVCGFRCGLGIRNNTSKLLFWLMIINFTLQHGLFLICVACLSEFDTSSSSCGWAFFIFSDMASWSQQKSAERKSSSTPKWVCAGLLWHTVTHAGLIMILDSWGLSVRSILSTCDELLINTNTHWLFRAHFSKV